MANNCYNNITITGESEQIEKIRYLMESTRGTDDGIFITLVGLPEGMTPTEYKEKWWETNVNYWGCRWNIKVDDLDLFECDNESIELVFDSDNAPPIPFCSKLADIFNVKVVNYYSEGGMGFTGEATCLPGGQVEDAEYNYLEGMYILRPNEFWDEFDNLIENICEENDTKKERVQALKDSFPYVTKKDLKTLKDKLNETIQDYGEES